MLSRLHRRVEALDSACLRALGHPHDHALRNELLSALEWEDSCDPHHARSIIRDTFKSVVDHSMDLAHHLRPGAPAAADPAAREALALKVAALLKDAAGASPADQALRQQMLRARAKGRNEQLRAEWRLGIMRSSCAPDEFYVALEG